MASHEALTIDCEPENPGYVAAYLRVAGGECAFFESYTARAVPLMLSALEARLRKPEDVRWVVVTHAHLDHAGGAWALLRACPNATLLAHPRAARHLVDPAKLVASATAVYGEAHFRAVYGAIEPIPAARVRALGDGEAFDLGGATFRVRHTAGHAKHHFAIDDPALSTVYTGDTFGLVYPALQRAGRFALATTSPTDFDPAEARRSLEIVLGLGAETARPTHFGEVSGLPEIAAQLGRWIDRSEAWLEEAASSDAPADELAKPIAAALRRAIGDEARAIGLDLGERDWSLLSLDIDLNADGIAFAAERRRGESRAPTERG